MDNPTSKFDTDSRVLFIYHLIPRKFDFLKWFAALGTTPISRFWVASCSVSVPYNIKMFLSGYQSIYMHCIVMPVKFKYGLSISVQRNRQFIFLVNGMNDPTLSSTQTQKCFLSIDGYQENLISLNSLPFLTPLQLVAFGGGGARGVHGRIQHQSACFWVSFDRYALHRVACKIWRWVVHLGSEK
jgi:hypothetical protein